MEPCMRALCVEIIIVQPLSKVSVGQLSTKRKWSHQTRQKYALAMTALSLNTVIMSFFNAYVWKAAAIIRRLDQRVLTRLQDQDRCIYDLYQSWKQVPKVLKLNHFGFFKVGSHFECNPYIQILNCIKFTARLHKIMYAVCMTHFSTIGS